MQQIDLSSKEYEEFLRCLSILKDICNDADIRAGKLRQRSNDQATVFELDLNSIIHDLDIPLLNIPSKIELLKIFSDQEVSITVQDDRSFSFSDEFSSIRFEAPELDFMDNKYITEEELNSIFTLNEEDVILSTDLSTTITDRMRIISKVFNVLSTQVLFDGEVASLAMQTASKEQTANILSGITTERVLNCVSSLVNTQFVIDHDGDIEFKMFNFQEHICSNTCSTSIGNVDICIYSRSSLVQE